MEIRPVVESLFLLLAPLKLSGEHKALIFICFALWFCWVVPSFSIKVFPVFLLWYLVDFCDLVIRVISDDQLFYLVYLSWISSGFLFNWWFLVSLTHSCDVNLASLIFELVTIGGDLAVLIVGLVDFESIFGLWLILSWFLKWEFLFVITTLSLLLCWNVCVHLPELCSMDWLICRWFYYSNLLWSFICLFKR